MWDSGTLITKWTSLTLATMEEKNTVWNKMQKLGLDRCILFIASISNLNVVKIECFLFRERSIKLGSFYHLREKSPLRLKDSIISVISSGAEFIGKNDVDYLESRNSTIISTTKLSTSSIAVGKFEGDSNCTSSLVPDIENKPADQSKYMFYMGTICKSRKSDWTLISSCLLFIDLLHSPSAPFPCT